MIRLSAPLGYDSLMSESRENKRVCVLTTGQAIELGSCECTGVEPKAVLL